MAATSAPDAGAASIFGPGAASAFAPRVDEGRGASLFWVCVGAAALLWPALWNGYPILFADTGTYLSQAMRLYVGWDRPPVYSVLLRALHWDRSLWPPVIAQVLLMALSVRIALRCFAPAWPGWATGAVCAALSVGTAGGVVASRLLPDVFAGVIVILLLAIVRRDDAWPPARQWACAGGAAPLIATHQSYLPLSAALLAAALVFGTPWRRVARAAAAPALAAVLLVGVNAAAFGRASLSPFGSVFLLARAIEDGPARDVIAQNCPAAGWRLCGRALPATADAFLWRPGALADAGGAKAVAPEAAVIVSRAWRTEPVTMGGAILANAARQAVTIDADDGLQDWTEVRPALDAFPAGQAEAYRGSRQAAGGLSLPRWLRAAQAVVAAAAVIILGRRAWRRDALAALVLVALAANAAVTGGLSGPHPRYASRIVWLAPLFAAIPPRKGRPLDDRAPVGRMP